MTGGQPGKQGRKPKPARLKMLEGNPGKRPLPTNEPLPSTDKPTCPLWLDVEAKREWKRISGELCRLGLLTIVDRVALTGYCEAYSRYRRAAEELKGGLTYTYQDKNGEIRQIAKPEVAIARDALNQVRQLCAEFGLTPSSRTRMTLPGHGEDEDPMEKLLSTHREN
jgi:P27 family predicted phage terminase small subunit